MNEELRKLIEEIRNEVGEKNTDILARLDSIEERAGNAPDAEDVKALRTELDEVKRVSDEREATIAEMQRRAREQAARQDPIRDRRQAIEMLGMIARQELASHLRCEVPQRFAGEAERVQTWREQRATLAVAGATGFVPTVASEMIFDTLEEVSSILQLADFVPNLPGKMRIPTITARPTLKWNRTSSDTAMTESDPGVGYKDFDPDEAYIIFPVDNNLITMSPYALGSLMFRLLQEGFVEGLAKVLVEADGSATYNSLVGFLNVSTAGWIYSMGSGKAAFADLEKSHLTGALAKTLKRGRARGSWFMSQEVLGICEDMPREGKVPVVQMGANGNPRVLQRPVEIDESMPTLSDSAASTGFIGFGDLAEYLVGLVEGIKLAASQEVYFNKNQTCFRATSLADVVRKGSASFVTIKTGAA